MRTMLIALFVLALEPIVLIHDLGKTPITWNREISRIVYTHCVSCHRPGGSSFSLLTYQDVQPRLVAFRDSVLSRRMPPWGAVKGFGDFRNDQGLTQEHIELITDWVMQDAPKGNNPNVLPKVPTFPGGSLPAGPAKGISVSGEVTLSRPLRVDGIMPERVPPNASIRIVAMRPQAGVEPLLWLYQYKDTFRHPFLFRRPLDLPIGTVIRGVPPDAVVTLIAAGPGGSK